MLIVVFFVLEKGEMEMWNKDWVEFWEWYLVEEIEY